MLLGKLSQVVTTYLITCSGLVARSDCETKTLPCVTTIAYGSTMCGLMKCNLGKSLARAEQNEQ